MQELCEKGSKRIVHEINGLEDRIGRIMREIAVGSSKREGSFMENLEVLRDARKYLSMHLLERHISYSANLARSKTKTSSKEEWWTNLSCSPLGRCLS